MEYKVKTHNKIKIHKGGFLKEDVSDKPRYDLIPYENLKRLAQHYANGAKKYEENNWKKADIKDINRFKESAWRHLVQWSEGLQDEDHASACIWNIMAYEWHKNKNGSKKI